MTDSHRPRVLVLTHRVPFPPDKGDRIRTYHILKWLSGKADVHLACLADEPVDPSIIAGLNGLCERSEIVPHQGLGRWSRALRSFAGGGTVSEGVFDSPVLRRLLTRWTQSYHYDTVFASASSLIPYLRRGPLCHIPSVIDLVDVDSQKWLDYAGNGLRPIDWVYRAEGRRLREVERKIADWASAITFVSEAEASLYRESCGLDVGPIHAVSNGVDFDYYHPDITPPGASESPDGCVFVGALDYRPNVDGAVWFCREVWPEIRRRVPEATLTLVGRRPVAAVQRLAIDCPGVNLVGQVPDVRPFVAKAALAVVPLRLARGVQNKVLEALAMRKAVISSPQAVAGVKAVAGRDLLVASSPEEWADAVSGLLADPVRRAELGHAGRYYVEENHCWETCLNPFGRLFGFDEERVASMASSGA